MKIGIFIMVFLSIVLVFSIAFSIVRWQKSQRERKQKTLAILFNRSNRLLNILQTISDRYLPISAKKVLLDYAFSITSQLVKESYGAQAEFNQTALAEIFDQVKLGEKAEVKTRIVSQNELARTQGSLQYLSRMFRMLADNRLVDKGTAKQNMSLLRYTHSLAYCDVLVRQATQDLDLDKKNRALEKYRTALAEMEKTSLGGYSGKEIAYLKNVIGDVEKKLFQSTD